MYIDSTHIPNYVNKVLRLINLNKNSYVMFHYLNNNSVLGGMQLSRDPFYHALFFLHAESNLQSANIYLISRR